jgi:hypothetical protein
LEQYHDAAKVLQQKSLLKLNPYMLLHCLFGLQQYHDAAKVLQEKGLRGPSRFMFWVDEGAGHHEGAWRWRLNGALRFLAQGWWDS